MEYRIAMRLRTLIELLAAIILTFAALIAISKMARATCLTVENAYAPATSGEAKNGAVFMTLNNNGSEPDRLRSAAADVARARGWHSILHTRTHALDLSRIAASIQK